jgi:cytochrome c oxidase subunit 2
MSAAKIERIFLALSASMLLVFLGALFYSAFGMGMHLPGRAGTLNPTEVRQTPPFDQPGVREVGPGRYEVVILGMAWAYDPSEIRVPAGAEVTFIATGTDVVHGLHVEGTRVNLMLVPGQIARITTTFDEPGEHRIVCHEYCGLGHHLMHGRVIVEEAAP